MSDQTKRLITQIQLRRDTEAKLAQVKLAAGEPCYVTETTDPRGNYLVIGNGTQFVSQLPRYYTGQLGLKDKINTSGNFIKNLVLTDDYKLEIERGNVEVGEIPEEALPAVHDGILTLNVKYGGEEKDIVHTETFSANTANNVTVDIQVPARLSELENDLPDEELSDQYLTTSGKNQSKLGGLHLKKYLRMGDILPEPESYSTPILGQDLTMHHTTGAISRLFANSAKYDILSGLYAKPGHSCSVTKSTATNLNHMFDERDNVYASFTNLEDGMEIKCTVPSIYNSKNGYLNIIGEFNGFIPSIDETTSDGGWISEYSLTLHTPSGDRTVFNNMAITNMDINSIIIPLQSKEAKDIEFNGFTLRLLCNSDSQEVKINHLRLIMDDGERVPADGVGAVSSVHPIMYGDITLDGAEDSTITPYNNVQLGTENNSFNKVYAQGYYIPTKSDNEVVLAGGGTYNLDDLKNSGAKVTITNGAYDSSTPFIGGLSVSNIGNAIEVTRKSLADVGLSTVYNYRGTVAKYDDLDAKSATAIIGDVWNVEENGGMNYAWNGTVWDNLGAIVDLDGYVTGKDLTDKYVILGSGESSIVASNMFYDQGCLVIPTKFAGGGLVVADTITGENAHANFWYGRVVAGSRYNTVAMGAFGGKSGVSAVHWTGLNGSINGASATESWDNLYISPEGAVTTYIGGPAENGWEADKGWFKVQGGDSGSVEVNIGAYEEPDWRRVLTTNDLLQDDDGNPLYVTLNTEQTITGRKIFKTGGIAIVGSAGSKLFQTRGVIGANTMGGEGELYLNYSVDYPVCFGKEDAQEPTKTKAGKLNPDGTIESAGFSLRNLVPDSGKTKDDYVLLAGGGSKPLDDIKNDIQGDITIAATSDVLTFKYNVGDGVDHEVTLVGQDLPEVNNGTLTMSATGTGLSGSATFSANQSNNTTFTATLDSSVDGNRNKHQVVIATANGQINSEKYAITEGKAFRACWQYNATTDCVELFWG